MAIERELNKQLLDWKNNPAHKALLIDGARQVGKTFAVRAFAEQNYQVFLEINFIENPSACKIFEGDLDVATIIMGLTAYTNTALIPGKTLVFFDEVQGCPRARSAIKFLVDDGRFDYIESGSLLGVTYQHVDSLPVGYEEKLRVYPLTFTEFALAIGIQPELLESAKAACANAYANACGDEACGDEACADACKDMCAASDCTELGFASSEVFAKETAGKTSSEAFDKADKTSEVFAKKIASDTATPTSPETPTNPQLSEAAHEQLLRAFRIYMAVGGMPAAVQAFVDTSDIAQVLNIQRDILALYKQDVAKYAPNKAHVNAIFDAIPAELSKRNKRFKLKDLAKSARMERYESDFMWLADAGVALPCYNVCSPSVPLQINMQHNLFKLYLCDVGLLSAATIGAVQFGLIQGDASINQGAFLENVLAQELVAHGFDLFYYDKSKIGEIDFILQKGSKILPIEAKSGKDFTAHKALDNLLAVKEWQLSSAVVLCQENAGGGAGDAAGLGGGDAGCGVGSDGNAGCGAGTAGADGGAELGSNAGCGCSDATGAAGSGDEQTPPSIAYLPWYAISFMEQDRLPEKLIVSI